MSNNPTVREPNVDEVYSLKPEDIKSLIKSLKSDDEFLLKVKGKNATLPPGSLLIYREEKNLGISDDCNNYCWQKGYLGCLSTGAGKNYGGEVVLEDMPSDFNTTGAVSCLCYK